MKEGFYYRDMNAAYYGIYWFGFDIRGCPFMLYVFLSFISIFKIAFRSGGFCEQ